MLENFLLSGCLDSICTAGETGGSDIPTDAWVDELPSAAMPSLLVLNKRPTEKNCRVMHYSACHLEVENASADHTDWPVPQNHLRKG